MKNELQIEQLSELQLPEVSSETYFSSRLQDIEEPSAPFGLLSVHSEKASFDELVVNLDENLSRRINQLSLSLNLSTNSFFHLAWAIVVSQCSGCSDVVFGTKMYGKPWGAISNKDSSAVGELMPMRLSLNNISLSQSLSYVEQELNELMDYTQTPLTEIQRISSVPVALPLFTSMISCLSGNFDENISVTNFKHLTLAVDNDLEGLTKRDKQNRHDNEDYLPFELYVANFGERGFELKYRTDTSIGSDTINRYVLEALKQIADALEDSPEILVESISVLNQVELQKILIDFNDTQKNHPTNKLAHSCFEEQAKKYSSHTALEFADEVLTYKELNERANQLAHYLINQGIKPEQPIAVYMPRCTEMIVALLGILKAGGIYVPIDPNYPEERCNFMLKDSNPLLLITVPGCREKLSNQKYKKLVLDDKDVDLDLIRKECKSNPNRSTVGISPSNAAYMIYTSGSTGLPKGVVVEHMQLVNYIYTLETLYGYTSADRGLNFCSISFDVSLEEIFGTLSHGGTLILHEETWIGSSQAFWDYCRGLDLSVLSVPTAYWHVLVEEPIRFPENLRLVVLGGEKINPEKIKQWFSLNHSAPRVINSYGPTETTMGSCARDITADEANDNLIGKPFDNEQFYIVDQVGRPVPVGVPGEILIAGAGVARGYLNRSKLTSEKFVDIQSFPEIASIIQPHISNGNRVYKTGDIGAWTQNGEIRYVGRNDTQVKVRGYRIELGEIENVISAFDVVEDSIVVTKKNGEQIQIVAYLKGALSRHEKNTYTVKLKQYLKNKLPAYSIPNTFIWMDKFPSLPSGKVDRSNLPHPEDPYNSEMKYEAPRDSLELSLCEIWQEVLDIPRVSRSDNFFELGGHRLLATKLIFRIEKKYQVVIQVHDLYEMESLSEMAFHLKMLMVTKCDSIQQTNEEEREVTEL